MQLKTLLPGILLSILTALPVAADAAVYFDLTPAGVTIHIGDRDHRGYYWDGYDWRAPQWWKAHRGRHIGEKGPRGYWNGNGWQSHQPETHHQQPARKKPAAHEKPIAHREGGKHQRLAADHHEHGAADHRPDFQPHG